LAAFLRLRQICLVAADLERETELLRSIFGIEVCYRDPNVARYGLVNVLFPLGTDFLEIVSPTREGTAAGRFLQRHAGRNGYMIIIDCDDPAARQRHAEKLGIRTANLIRHEGYLGVQLHPKDTGAAMIEFNNTEGGENSMGPYGPAGANWQKHIRSDVSRKLVAAEIDCPDAAAFSSRWGELLQRPALPLPGGRFRIALDSGAIHFLPSDVPEAVLAGLEFEVVDRARVVDAARARSRVSAEGSVDVCGVRVRLSEAA